MRLEPLGDSAVIATLASGIDEAALAAVRGFAGALAAARVPGVTDIVPAYDTVTVFYDPAAACEPGADAYAAICRALRAAAASAPAAAGPGGEEHEIPVCYGGEFGPDLPTVAAQGGVPPSEVPALHSGATYLVHAIGFTPGFPYLGGLPAVLRAPRRPTPRARVPAGSVAIGGLQTGIYPVASPGGWQIIGRTPLVLFRPEATPAALLRPGDRVRFRPISETEFRAWR